jgi:hypothetical protein
MDEYYDELVEVQIPRKLAIKLKSILSQNPTADVSEVKHGQWLKKNNEKKCSLCKFIYYSNKDEWTFCPNCGAKMEGKNDF